MCICVCLCVSVCVCSRSTGTGFFGCQLQSALTCASNVVYCPNISPEEHLRRPLKFKAIYHYLPPPPPPRSPCVSHHPSLPPPSPRAVTISSFSSPPSSLILPSLSITPFCASCFARIRTQMGLIPVVFHLLAKEVRAR